MHLSRHWCDGNCLGIRNDRFGIRNSTQSLLVFARKASEIYSPALLQQKSDLKAVVTLNQHV